MSSVLAGWAQAGLVALVVLAAVRPLGGYLSAVYAGRPTLLQPILRPVETVLYRLAGIDPAAEQRWSDYAIGLLVFHAVGTAAVYALLRLQALLPLNPQGFGAVPPALALDTAISFVSNTSWQSYGGETTLSHLSQMAGITVQSFLSAAAGLAVAIALCRGFARQRAARIGNVWVDLVRGVLHVLLPAALLAALWLLAEGVPQSLAAGVTASPLAGGTQSIALGPVAGQESIKLLSGDGGGFFNVNSAHPFENPTAPTNLVEIILMLLLGAALTNTFGRMVGNERQGWALLGAMAILFGLGLGALEVVESAGNPLVAGAVEQGAGNLEGKEVRFGVAGSALFAEASTAASDGAVDAMHDSFLPLGGAVLLANMMTDEVVIGAPGSGLWGTLLFCLVAVMLAGLMVGRTPEFVGKKIESREMKMTVLALLAAPGAILALTALACVVPAGLAGPAIGGPHGFSELLYAYTSAAATNGSAFAGLNATSDFFNLTLALAMFLGRFAVIVPVLAIAGALAAKPIVPASAGVLPTDGLQFVLLLVATIVIVGGLSFFPALALGPIAEHVGLLAGRTY